MKKAHNKAVTLSVFAALVADLRADACFLVRKEIVYSLQGFLGILYDIIYTLKYIDFSTIFGYNEKGLQ